MHLTCTISRGWVCCADWKLSSQRWCPAVWWDDLVGWPGVAVVVCWSDGLIGWSGLMMVCCVFGCGGLIWVLIWLSVAVFWRAGFREDGLVWRLKIEKIRICVSSGKMTQLSVRELRQKKQKKRKYFIFFKIQLQLWKASGFNLNRKGLPKPNQTDSNDHCDSFPFEITI